MVDEDRDITNEDQTEDQNLDEQAGTVAEAFDDLKEHDSTPTVPFNKVEKIRFSEGAKALDDARLYAYVEANFGIQALKIVQQLIPMLVGLT